MKKGFTLIEVLAVIALMGIIMLIVVPSVTKVMQNSKQKLNESQEKIIIESAKMAVAESASFIYKNDNYSSIFISDLIDNGYLTDTEIKNLVTDKDLVECAYVKMTENGNNFDYEFVDNYNCD